MIKIKNNTLLPYKVIGSIIDKYMVGSGVTIYEGKQDHVYFEYKERHYKLEIAYSKKDVKYTFSNAKG